jgi:hypothetical protein
MSEQQWDHFFLHPNTSSITRVQSLIVNTPPDKVKGILEYLWNAFDYNKLACNMVRRAVGGEVKASFHEVEYRFRMMIALGRYDENMVNLAGQLIYHIRGRFIWDHLPFTNNREFYIAARSLSEDLRYLLYLLSYELKYCGSIDTIYGCTLMLKVKGDNIISQLLFDYFVSDSDMVTSISGVFTGNSGINKVLHVNVLSVYMFMVLNGNAVTVFCYLLHLLYSSLHLLLHQH